MKFNNNKIFLKIFTVCLTCTFFVFFSCNNYEKKEQSNAKDFKQEEDEISLKKQILTGDTMAYFQLRRIYITKNKPTDFLFWSVIMANKYNFKVANYDVFFCIEQANRYYGVYSKEKKTYSNSIDSITSQFAKSYLYQTSDTDLIEKTLRFYNKDTSSSATTFSP